MFLIYNTVSATVVRRRLEIGILRAVGATRGEVQALFLGEAMLFGVVGVVLGWGGGVLLSKLLLGAVARTISSLYLLVSVDRGFLSMAQFALSGVFGLGAVLLAAWQPSYEASRLPPVQALLPGTARQEARGWGRASAWIGGAMLLLGGGLAWLALTRWAIAGFGAALCVQVGFAFFAAQAVRLSSWLARMIWRRGILLRLVFASLARFLRRNAVTVAALSAAVAMMVSVSVMIFSFRSTVNVWINRSIVADLFLSPASNETVGLQAFVPEAVREWWKHQPAVEALETLRELPVTVNGATQQLAVVSSANRRDLQFIGGHAPEKMARFFAGDVLVTESYARRHHVSDGDQLSIATPQGLRAFTVAGVYYDYSRDEGLVVMNREVFNRLWNDPRIESLAIYLRPGTDAPQLQRDFLARFDRNGEFVVYSNAELRTRIFQVFDQTFAVTNVLRFIAVIVAITGIFLSVTSLVSERTREIGVLRAIGASLGQLRGLLLAEAASLGFIASLLGLLSGLVLAFLLTGVINPAFFGWTIPLRLPWLLLLATPLWIVPLAAAAAWWPARQASRIKIAEAVRFE
ncbi:MAG: FtsX-like permease family protein [Chthoniobacteraceae bacterium]